MTYYVVQSRCKALYQLWSLIMLCMKVIDGFAQSIDPKYAPFFSWVNRSLLNCILEPGCLGVL